MALIKKKKRGPKPGTVVAKRYVPKLVARLRFMSGKDALNASLLKYRANVLMMTLRSLGLEKPQAETEGRYPEWIRRLENLGAYQKARSLHDTLAPNRWLGETRGGFDAA